MNLFATAYTYGGPSSSSMEIVYNLKGHGETFAFLGMFWLSFLLFFLAFLVLVLSVVAVIGLWKVFVKAGQKGWAAIIPVYNIIILLRIINKPYWWVFFYFVPFINVPTYYITIYELAKTFKREIGFTFGMLFLPFIFYPILGFGKSEYNNPAKQN
jgi:hypothetical protein